MKIIKTIPLLVLLVMLAGCDSVRVDTIVKAGEYLKKNDLKHFKDYLAQNALTEFGNPAGMKFLQDKLNGLDLEAGKEVLTSTTGPAICRKYESVFIVPVYKKNASTSELVFNAELLCKTTWSCQHGNQSSWESCWITEVKFN